MFLSWRCRSARAVSLGQPAQGPVFWPESAPPRDGHSCAWCDADSGSAVRFGYLLVPAWCSSQTLFRDGAEPVFFPGPIASHTDAKHWHARYEDGPRCRFDHCQHHIAACRLQPLSCGRHTCACRYVAAKITDLMLCSHKSGYKDSNPLPCTVLSCVSCYIS
jgi:hypothetical protein